MGHLFMACNTITTVYGITQMYMLHTTCMVQSRRTCTQDSTVRTVLQCIKVFNKCSCVPVHKHLCKFKWIMCTIQYMFSMEYTYKRSKREHFSINCTLVWNNESQSMALNIAQFNLLYWVYLKEHNAFTFITCMVKWIKYLLLHAIFSLYN